MVKPALPYMIFRQKAHTLVPMCPETTDSARILKSQSVTTSKIYQQEDGKALHKTHRTATNTVVAVVKHDKRSLLLQGHFK